MASRKNSRGSVVISAVAILSACSDGPGTAPFDVATVAPMANEHQFGIAGTSVTLLPSVVVRNPSGNPIPGVTVSFVPSSGGGTVAGPQPVTDANGVATLGGWVLGSAIGENRLTVSVPGYPIVPAIFRADGLGAGFDLDSVAAGANHSCGLNAEGKAYCWGSNSAGSLGDGTLTNRVRPVAVSGNHTFKAIAASSHSCAITREGIAWCWGSNSDGQLGDGTTTDSNTPRRVAGSLIFQSIATGAAHTCGLLSDGRAFCWGDNSSGQLGDGTVIDRLTPVAVGGGLRLRNLSPTGGNHTCGVTLAGGAYCWGDNSTGGLGDNSTVNRSLPVPVATTTLFQTIRSDGHTCGITAAGAAYCWGKNSASQTGDGTTTNRLVPTPVSGGYAFRNIDPGANHSCGVTVAGTGICWGANDRGQLGDASVATRTLPVAASRGLRLAAISAGTHSCAVTVDDGVFCWGENGTGALGSGSLSSSAGPLPVLSP
jgi:alpha-tubulin suppressor-like RCC1 family protein